MDDQGNSVIVNVKWMGKQFDGLRMSLDEPLESFKKQLSSLTGVPPERQKIMFKGIIPNDADLSKIKITNGARLMLIGSAEKPPECIEKVRFFDELSSQEKAKFMNENIIVKLPPGIMNLGNTCYFNSVVQFLFPVTELWNSVSKCLEGKANTPDVNFAKSLLDMKKQLNHTLERFVPLVQIQFLRKINPLFCRKDDKTGMYMQQDAEECLNCILGNLNSLSEEKISENVFGFSMVSNIKPVKSEGSESCEPPESETPPEETVTSVEHNLVLSCYMGTPLKSVGTLMDGINLSLNEELLKFSEKDGCDVLHNKVTKLSSLPKYLIVHLVRFEWKQKSQVSHTDAIKAKVCRRVNFERYIDITSICSEVLYFPVILSQELQQKLRAARSHQIKKEDKLNEGLNGEVKDGNKSEGESCDVEMVNLDGYEMSPGEYATGKYELISIVTHQGRTADAGHYICWTKDTREYPTKNSSNSNEKDLDNQENRENEPKKKKQVDMWIKFDDDVVSEHDWGSFDLCGGRSDYHIAVLLLYKSQNTTL
uniref:Ubiquitin carboxyl-terminal hydrolase n=1 Tax=Theileria annulata TaxID=5874 RepID=A0A3B0N0H1_THEAN